MMKKRLLAAGLLVVACVAVLHAVATYPSGVASFPTRVNGQTIDASWFNSLQDEVVAVESALINGFVHVLKPQASGTYDLGTSGLAWKDLYLSGNVKIGGNTIYPAIAACGRLTLTTGVPVTTADVTAATAIYFTPIVGCNSFTVFASSALKTDTLTETTVAVPATTSQMYDVFAFDNAGAINIELLAWTNDTTRATAITVQNGFLAKSGDATRRYVGSVRTTTVSGQTEDSLVKRYVWNYYNRVPRIGRVVDATGSWTYTTATYRQANGAAGNQLDFVIGVAEVEVSVRVTAAASNTNAGVGVSVGIGEDSTTTNDAGTIIQRANSAVANDEFGVFAELRKYPAVGRHTYVWLEVSAATGTTTWDGTLAGPPAAKSGIVGEIQG